MLRNHNGWSRVTIAAGLAAVVTLSAVVVSAAPGEVNIRATARATQGADRGRSTVVVQPPVVTSPPAPVDPPATNPPATNPPATDPPATDPPVVTTPPVEASGDSYYLSCSGSDSSNGRSASNAWRTLAHAEKADLRPGDQLLLQRGCQWNGDRLDIGWSGTSAAPIIIGNYGSSGAALPLIRNGKNSNVKITGSHLVVRGLRSHFDPFNQISCGQSIGNVYGFNFTGGARDVTLTGSETSGATAGIHLSQASGRINVIGNSVHDNNVLTSFGANPANDLGAWGILVRSDGNVISSNHIRNNRATCRNQGFKLHSNSVEVYEGSNNLISNNLSEGDRVFSELGSSSSKIATGNVFERNVFITDLATSRFITTRGPNSSFGPVANTQVRHNTMYQTGPESQGVVCGSGCSVSALELRNNIIVAEEKAVFADGPIVLGPNVVWNSTGEPYVQIRTLPDIANSPFIVGNPRFVQPAVGNVRLASNSPALNRADGSGVVTRDPDGAAVPSSNRDIGAFER